MSYQDVQHHYVEYPVPCPHGEPEGCCCCEKDRAEKRAEQTDAEIGELQQLLRDLYGALGERREVKIRETVHAYLAQHGLLEETP